MSGKAQSGKKEKMGKSEMPTRGGEAASADVVKDTRFAHVHNDPRFKRMPVQKQKLKVDQRFKAMFTSDKFKTKYSVDKRGREINRESSEDLKKYYELSDEEGADVSKDAATSSSSQDKPKSKKPEKPSKAKRQAAKEAEDESDADRVDSDASVDDVEMGASSDEELAAEAEAEYGDDLAQEEQVPRGESTSRRIAVLNMDWSRVRAVDLFVLFQSFLPSGGAIESVAIYPSEYGLQKLKEESEEGPKGLWKDAEQLKAEEEEELASGKKKSRKQTEDDDDDPDADLYRGFDMEKLRAYEKEKMRYFYAVIVCDTTTTAAHLYKECDGIEYERTSNILDLRFIPDDVQFEHEARDEARDVPADYQAPHYYSSALQLTKVRFTWDETDPHRVDALTRPFENRDYREEDLLAYVASESDTDAEGSDAAVSASGSEGESDEESDAGNAEKSKGGERKRRVVLKKKARNKYAALLAELKGGDSSKKSSSHTNGDHSKEVNGSDNDDEKDEASSEEEAGNDLEIVFEPGLKEAGEKMLKQTQKKEAAKAETVWEKYQRERKEKRKQRKREEKAATADDAPVSDEDDIPDELRDDPFFQEELAAQGKATKKAKKSKPQDADEAASGSEDEEMQSNRQAEMELLLMDDDGKNSQSRGYSLQTLKMQHEMQKGTLSKRKRKLLQEELKSSTPDDFKVDVEDPRFTAMFEKAEYHIDPTNPSFKATAATEKLLVEHQKRRQAALSSQEEAVRKRKAVQGSEADGAVGLKDNSLQSLVASVKSKAKAAAVAEQPKKKAKF